MIMAVPSTTSGSELDSPRAAGSEWAADTRVVRVRESLMNSDVASPLQEPSLVTGTLQQLFHMTLSSLRGYQDLAQLSTQPELRTLLDVIARQRCAQCRALARMTDGLIPEWMNLEKSDDDALADPSAADLQIVWLRTIWSFEQDEFARFGENLDQAELMLEDALLGASEAFPDGELTTVFRQHAINICGARQCLEDVVGDHISSERY